MGSWTADVAYEDVIDPDWGNAIRDRVVHTFSSTAERDSEIVSGDRQIGMLAVTGTGASAVLWMWDGSAWVSPRHAGAPTSYASTLGGSGWAIGNGTVDFKYVRVGRAVHFSAVVTFGSTSTFGATNPSIGIPVTAAYDQVFTADLVDTGTGSSLGIGILSAGGTAISVRPLASSGSYVTRGGMTSTIPHTWGNTDKIVVSGTILADADA